MRINNIAPSRNVEAVHSIKPSRRIDNFIDFRYKLERNEYNRQLYLDNLRLKAHQNLLKSQNNINDSSSPNIHFEENMSLKRINNGSSNDNIKINSSYDINSAKSSFDSQRISAYSKLMFEAESRRQMHNINDKPSYDDIVKSLARCKKDLTDFASMTLLVNASYLISPTAVLSLLNFKDEDA